MAIGRFAIAGRLAKGYKAPSMLDCPVDKTTKLANIGTRLAHLDNEAQRKLIN